MCFISRISVSGGKTMSESSHKTKSLSNLMACCTNLFLLSYTNEPI